MAAKVRLEWIVLGPADKGQAENVIKRVVGKAAAFDVSATPTIPGSQPVAPAVPDLQPNERLYARVSGVSGNTIAHWGRDPTAAQDNGILVPAGGVEVLPAAPAETKLSFVELA